MTALLVQIRHPQGQVLEVALDTEFALVGSGAHCDIRLPIDQAALEHLSLQNTPGGLYMQALSFDPPPTVGGVAFTQGPLESGGVVEIGAIQLTVSITEAAAPKPTRKEGTSLVSIVAFAGILIGAYLTFFMEEPRERDIPPREAPGLFGAAEATCPESGPREQALALAQERLASADTKRERRPFYVQDGIHAVPLYEQAAKCLAIAGHPHEAAEAAAAAELLKTELDIDYRTHRVRLEHFLGVEDLVAARREVRILLQFTEGKQDSYVTWLSNLDRKLKRKLGRPAS